MPNNGVIVIFSNTRRGLPGRLSISRHSTGHRLALGISLQPSFYKVWWTIKHAKASIMIESILGHVISSLVLLLYGDK